MGQIDIYWPFNFIASPRCSITAWRMAGWDALREESPHYLRGLSPRGVVVGPEVWQVVGRYAWLAGSCRMGSLTSPARHQPVGVGVEGVPGAMSSNCCPVGGSLKLAALDTIFEICPLVALALGRK